jgi:transcriptional regulator of acetoin/glycerol metabolism
VTDQGEWIEQIDRLDRLLHAQGVPSAVRCKALGEIATILAQASKQKQDRRQLVLAALAANNNNVRAAAKAEGWSHETFYAELRRRLSNHPVTI